MHKLTMIALKAAVQGAQAIMKVYEKDDFEVRFKNDNSPLTEADVNSHLAIERILVDTEIPVLSEEGDEVSYDTRKLWTKLWLVDPLDGTKEFVKRTGEFTVNIALVEDNYPVLGVVLAPALNMVYWGDADGAYKSTLHKKWLKHSPMEVITDLDPVKLGKSEVCRFTAVASVSHFSPEDANYAKLLQELKGDIDTVSVGSSLKMCLVADGQAHLYPRLGSTMEWDTAAGQAVIEAAGGSLLCWHTKDRMGYNRHDLTNGWFLAASKGVDANDYWLISHHEEGEE